MILIENYGLLKATGQSPLMCANYYNYWVIWEFKPLKYRKGLGTLVVINGIDCRIEKTNIEK